MSFLPIGTVIKLNKSNKLVMVTGFLCKNSDGSKSSDYSGCLYPEGIVSPDLNLFFNNSDIESIIYYGLSDEEDKAFKIQLEKVNR